MARRRDVWIAGAFGAAFASAALAYLVASGKRDALLVLLAAEIAAGREAGIPAGLATQQLTWQEAAFATSLIELTSLFALFPLLVGLATGLHKVRWLESHLARAQDYARRNPDVDVLALGALTFVPFVPVGALTSVLIGELLRLPSRYLLPTLAAALVLANLTMGYATARLIERFPRPELVAAGMTLLVLAVAGAGWIWHRRHHTTKSTLRGR